MTLEWSEWKHVETYDAYKGDFDPQRESRQLTPYVHWSTLGPGEDDIGTPTEGPDGEFPKLILQRLSGEDPIKQPWFEDFVGLEDPLPIPFDSSSKEDLSVHRIPDELPILENKDTVIAGVIDVGIPLGHWRTRMECGHSRILAAWQMLGAYQGEDSNVPFGRELLKDEIDKLLHDHSGSRQDGPLNQEAFDRATDGVTMPRVGGQSDLARRFAHGAHVLDLAVGDDPFNPVPLNKSGPNEAPITFRDNVAIIAVNTPSAATFGAGGTYLEQFLFHAIARIVLLADAIWENSFGQPSPGERKGFKVVINMAYGRQAAAEESFDRFRKALATFARERHRDFEPVEFIMPVGNDNQAQSNAFLEPDSKESLPLDWHVPPQDQSSNFVEIWTKDGEETEPPVIANLTGPHGEADLPPLPSDRNSWLFSDLTDGSDVLARAYAKRVCIDENGDEQDPDPTLARHYRLAHTFCIAPTYRPQGSPQRGDKGKILRGKFKPSGTAGIWTLHVSNMTTLKLRCRLVVQTDQGLTPNRSINRRSFFEHRDYQKYDSMGRLKDSYSFPPDHENKVVNQDIETTTPIRRHGTMLAMAAHSSVARVGGYRGSDGRPAFYSSTGRGRDNGKDIGSKLPFETEPINQHQPEDKVKRAPTVSMQTEDSPALFGILSAGAMDGSVAAMRGTSFATPQATRIVVSALLRGSNFASANQTLFELAKDAEEKRNSDEDNSGGSPAKGEFHGLREPAITWLAEATGGGRIPPPVKRTVDRRG